jgi:hypothetical protein
MRRQAVETEAELTQRSAQIYSIPTYEKQYNVLHMIIPSMVVLMSVGENTDETRRQRCLILISPASSTDVVQSGSQVLVKI